MKKGELERQIKAKIFSRIIGMDAKKYPILAKSESAKRDSMLQQLLSEAKQEIHEDVCRCKCPLYPITCLNCSLKKWFGEP